MIARILIPVILVGILVVPLAVASTIVSIEDPSAPQGSTVTVPINITDVENMCGANIWLSYDKNVVTVEKVDDGDISTVTYSIDNDAGIAKMAWDTTEGQTGSFVFAYITLKAVANPGDTSPLDLDVKELYDCDLGDIMHTVTDGTFTIPPTPPLLCTNPDPPSHDFDSVPEGQTRTWTFDITNCGGSTLTWTVSDDRTWITINPPSGSTTTETDTVTVTINTTGLACGTTHNGTITVNSNDGTKTGTIRVYVPPCTLLIILDTGPGDYPSIFGRHNGTIKPNQTITVHKLYTYPCAGTGGHTEHIRIWNDTWAGKEAYWKGYQGDWHNITFDDPFTLFAEKTYKYEIRTGSYPQIIHRLEHTTLDGSFINCTKFVDANGREYTDWIPAIRLFL